MCIDSRVVRYTPIHTLNSQRILCEIVIFKRIDNFVVVYYIHIQGLWVNHNLLHYYNSNMFDIFRNGVEKKVIGNNDIIHKY